MKKLIIPIILFFPILLQAHGIGGTVEKVSGEYLIDVGYSDPYPRAMVPIKFDYLIYTNANHLEVPYDATFVKISKGNVPIFSATTSKPEFGAAGMTFTFPEATDYKFEISYLKDNKILTAADFNMTIQPNQPAVKPNFFKSGYVLFIGGLVLGLLIQLILGKTILRK